ncbi:3-carboxy-cis,cis-muconate cycloisomerase [Peteryoungia ipomoeae]|uniref:3-carboxy-cis,cis-muconate cycloisomerase n=1 Tax=Peteryoungia ipomoeae TaxID=1210932 RepID=A0A4S8NV37_9HYPH|nr:3-carboxy-cis,cis-muconate cycloisomerase [Peteryoungia ipomoeae]THV20631.1 3-carboxy-cis,cis-muconate cycloisomerase [Peteryoungia ipomoeae]
MTASVFDHPFLSGLLGDPETAALFSAQADLAAMLRIEVALADVQAACGLVPKASAETIAGLAETFVPDMHMLAVATARDGVVIPELVRQWRAALGEAGKDLHFGATSQDVIDTSLMLRLQSLCQLLTGRLERLEANLGQLNQKFGAARLMGHTRMQAAIEISVADRIVAWQAPLAELQGRLAHWQSAGLPLQFGGAAGTLDKLGDQGAIVRSQLAQRLGLADRPQWHAQRAIIADVGNTLSLVSGSLGKIGQDLALMAQSGTAIIGGGGASSAMPHKRNPVKAEILVTLARFNAVQVAGLHQSLVHEQERSGAAWTLEWLLLPQMAIAAGAATRIALDLLASIEALGQAD